jgi:RHS repeat-associated protein
MFTSIHHSKLTQRVLLLTSLFLLLCVTSRAQSPKTAARPDRGLAAGASFSVSDIDNVNLSNGNVNISIPLASLPPIAGGKLKLDLNAIYNSKLWDVVRTEKGLGGQTGGCQSTFLASEPQMSDNGGWRVGGASYVLLFHDAMEDVGYLVPSQQCDITEWTLLQNRWKKLVLTTPDGATHELRPTDAYQPYSGSREYLHGYYKDTPDTIHAPMRYYSYDGSHLWAVVNQSGSATSWTVYMPDGTQIIQTSNAIQRIKDTNGNSIKFYSDTQGSHIQDEQTGREIKMTYDAAGNGGQGQGHILYQMVGGTWMSIDINYGTTHIQGKLYRKEEGVNGETCNTDTELSVYEPVIREIVFPATEPGVAPKRFTFGYDSDQTETATTAEVYWACNQPPTSYTRTASIGMGSLSRIVTPSGGVVNYSYGLESVHYFQEIEDIVREPLAQKTVTHDGTTDTWQYSIGTFGGGSITKPDGSIETASVYPTDTAFARQVAPGSDGKNGLSYRTNTDNKVIVERHWQLMPFSGANTEATGAIGQFAQFNPVVDAEYTSLLNAQGGVARMSARTFQYDYNGNPLQTTDYDWFDPSLVTRDSVGVPTGVPGGATVLRVVNNSYYNPATTATSANLYAKRSLSTATPLILDAPKETTVGGSDARFSYDSQSWGTPPTVGNLTTESRLDDKGDTDASNDIWITVSSTYGAYGNPATTTDPLGHVTQVFYDDATHALPNRVLVDPLNGTGQQTTTTAYDYYTGLATSVTDANGQVTSIDYTNQLLGTVDPFGRPGQVIGPAVTVNNVSQHQRLKNIYEDNLRRITVAADMNSEGDGLLKSRTTKDQLGRVTLAEQSEDGTNYTISSSMVYEQTGRITYASSPLRATASDTDSWSRTTHDALGRVTEVATFKGRTRPSSAPANLIANWTGSITTSFDANRTTVMDQQNKARQSQTDALGRLTQVIEDPVPSPSPSPSPYNYQTAYIYDPLGNLRQVTQGIQNRYFMYDSLSRLIRASNPEQVVNSSLSPALTDTVTQHQGWSLAYTYQANGNLLTRTDARNVTTTFGYDALNRVTSKTYTDSTPAVNYYYDGAALGKGRLWQTMTSDPAHRNSYLAVNGYDAMGRPLSQRQEFYYFNTASQGYYWSQDYTVQRTYDLTGHVKTQNYPSGHAVSYSYDGAGRTQSFTGNLGDGAQRNYATGIAYGPLNVMTQEQFGTTTPVFNKHLYNSRGQLAEIRESTTGGDTSWNRGAVINQYSNHGWGAGSDGSDNNGNLQRQEIYVPNNDQVSSWVSWYQAYGYDNLNRLTQVHEYTGNSQKDWQQAYSYPDQWGNRLIDQNNTFSQVGGPVIPHPQFTAESTTNKLYVTGDTNHQQMSYDPAGNLVNDSYTSYGSTNGSATRGYDGENRLSSAPDNLGGTSIYTYDADGKRVRRKTGSAEVWQVYGMDGELLSEYAANTALSAPQKEYGYRNGEMLISAATSSNTSVNVSQGKATTQSSVLYGAGANLAVDGNTDGNYAHNSVTSTNYEGQPWWQVDLGSSQAIQSIQLWNRTDCCSYRLANFYLFVSDQPFVSTDLQTTINQSGVWNSYTAGAVSTSSTIAVNRSGRYVRVQLAATDVLSLAEVQVIGQAGGGGPDIEWLVTDQLGTPRMVLDQSGSLAGVKRHDYLPFGEELFVGTGGRTPSQGYAGDAVRQKFTQKERDNETGLDYFPARYYSSTQGRFTSPDDFLNDTHVHDPSSWNLYTYVRNNPLKLVDPTGEAVNGAGLTDAERQQLIDDWQRKTGYNHVYFDKNNNLVIDRNAGIGKDANGKFLGSADARANLTDAIETKDIFNLEHANGSNQVAFADNELTQTTTNAQTHKTFLTYRVRIDFSDFNHTAGDREAQEANSIGLVVLHEFDHNLYGHLTDSPNGPNDPGPVETNYINPIREQLGLAQRATYSAVPVGGVMRDVYRGHVQVRYTLNGTDKILRWQDTVVGGVHH